MARNVYTRFPNFVSQCRNQTYPPVKLLASMGAEFWEKWDFNITKCWDKLVFKFKNAKANENMNKTSIDLPRYIVFSAAQSLWLLAWHFLVWLHNPTCEPPSRLHAGQQSVLDFPPLADSSGQSGVSDLICASSSSLRLVSTAVPVPFTCSLYALLSSATTSHLSTSAPPLPIFRLQASMNLSKCLSTDRVPVASWP